MPIEVECANLILYKMKIASKSVFPFELLRTSSDGTTTMGEITLDVGYDAAVEVLSEEGDVDVAEVRVVYVMGNNPFRDTGYPGTETMIRYLYREEDGVLKLEPGGAGLKVRLVPDPRPILRLKLRIASEKERLEKIVTRTTADIKKLAWRIKKWNDMQ